jgi:hypothetical protein
MVFQKLKVLFVVTCSEVELLAQRRRLCPVIPKGLNKLKQWLRVYVFFCWRIPNQASTLVKMSESMTLDFRNMKQQVRGAYGM